MSATTAFETLAVRLAVSDGIHRFFDLIDHGRASATVPMFHADASWTFGPGTPQPGTISGHANIRAAMEARENLKSAFTRHIITNILFDRITASGADVRYQMILFRSDDDTRVALPSFVADVTESWVEDEGQFKIMSRLIVPAFAKA